MDRRGDSRLEDSSQRSWRIFVIATSVTLTASWAVRPLEALQTSRAQAHEELSGSAAAAISGDAPFLIQFKDSHSTFRQGETLTLELAYGADPQAKSIPFTAHQDRPGLAVDELHIEPKDGIVDPMRDFLATVGGWIGPPPRSLPFVEEHGEWATADLNEWFRFDERGKYRVYITAYRVRNRFEGFGARQSGVATIKSNTLEFEIVAAEPAWQAAELQKALALLESGKELESCRMLRFLTSQAAVHELIKHYDDQSICTAQYRYGLFAFPDHEYVMKRMEDGIVDPTQPISADYLDTLARLAVYVDYGKFEPEVQTEQDRFARKLVDALPDKIGRARALSLKGIFDSPFLGRPTVLRSNDEALIGILRKALAEVFTDLPVNDQSTLLWVRWSNIASPAMVPVLERLYRNPPPGTYAPQFVGMVLQRLYEVAPSEGRALILEEMKRPHPRFDLRFVRLLPDKEIPELDEPLIENLETSNGEGETTLELIARYATPSIFPRVMALEEDRIGRMSCQAQSALLEYAFKVDASSGPEMLTKALASRKETGCYKTILAEVGRHHMSPQIEQIAVAHLSDSDLELAAGAAATLGQYGSAAAEQPLWDRLRKWHGSWAERAGELPNGYGSGLPNGLETGLEMALIEALATGRSWFAGHENLARLGTLCVSQGGCGRARNMIQEWSDAPVVTIFPQPEDRYSAVVNQYQIDSLGSLKRKLAQFPRGTTFKWGVVGDPKDGRILAEIRAFVEQQGMTIQ